MTIATLDTHQMLGVVSNIPVVTPFWLNLAFPMVQTFDTEWIDFDTVDESKRLAPFVAPNVNGKVMTAEGFSTRRFKPAYVKPKDVVDPTRVIKRRAGEALGAGSLSPDQRRDAVIADILRVQRDMILRRLDWMACRAIVDGSVTVSGESYPSQTISFGRDGAQTITLSGATLWTAGTSTPLANLQTWYTQTQRLSSTPVRNLIFGTAAWAYKSQDDLSGRNKSKKRKL